MSNETSLGSPRSFSMVAEYQPVQFCVTFSAMHCQSDLGFHLIMGCCYIDSVRRRFSRQIFRRILFVGSFLKLAWPAEVPCF